MQTENVAQPDNVLVNYQNVVTSIPLANIVNEFPEDYIIKAFRENAIKPLKEKKGCVIVEAPQMQKYKRVKKDDDKEDDKDVMIELLIRRQKVKKAIDKLIEEQEEIQEKLKVFGIAQ